jgi:hypothetical protein
MNLSVSDCDFLRTQFAEFSDPELTQADINDLVEAHYTYDHYHDNPAYMAVDSESSDHA